MLTIRTIWLGGADDADYDDDVLMLTIRTVWMDVVARY